MRHLDLKAHREHADDPAARRIAAAGRQRFEARRRRDSLRECGRGGRYHELEDIVAEACNQGDAGRLYALSML